jgi:hypothetical protein
MCGVVERVAAAHTSAGVSDDKVTVGGEAGRVSGVVVLASTAVASVAANASEHSEMSGGEHDGGEHSGDEHSGDEHSGGKRSGDGRSGAIHGVRRR